MASTVWKGQLTFGLVSIPVRLVRAARRERVRMHYVSASPATTSEREDVNDASPVRSTFPFAVVPNREKEESRPGHVERVHQSLLTGNEEAPMARRNLLKAHEVAPDRFVTFEQRELRALRPQTSAEMQIVRSVRLDEIDPVYFETSYYVAADRGGERAYALLFSALKQSRYVAIAELTMHGRQHVIVVRPGKKGLLAHTMFYADEIQAENEFEAGVNALEPKETTLAINFVEAIAGPFAPEEFTDKSREKLQSLISEKMARNEVTGAANAGPPMSPAAATIDIMDALRRSLEETTKPVAKRGPGKATSAPRRVRAQG